MYIEVQDIHEILSEVLAIILWRRGILYTSAINSTLSV